MQREVWRSLDLLLHVEVNGKEQALSSQFLPCSLCLLQTHTRTRTYEWAHTLPVALANVARKCLLFLLYPPLHVLKVKVFVIAESQPPVCSQRWEMWLTVCLLLRLVGGDLRKKQQRIPLYPRQPGESSQHETVRTQKKQKKQQLLGVMKWSAQKCNVPQ